MSNTHLCSCKYVIGASPRDLMIPCRAILFASVAPDLKKRCLPLPQRVGRPHARSEDCPRLPRSRTAAWRLSATGPARSNTCTWTSAQSRPTPVAPVATLLPVLNSRISEGIFRVGMNYKFEGRCNIGGKPQTARPLGIERRRQRSLYLDRRVPQEIPGPSVRRRA